MNISGVTRIRLLIILACVALLGFYWKYFLLVDRGDELVNMKVVCIKY